MRFANLNSRVQSAYLELAANVHGFRDRVPPVRRVGLLFVAFKRGLDGARVAGGAER